MITHPLLNGAGDRLITEEGYHSEERVYLLNRIPFKPVAIGKAVEGLDDLFHDFPFANQTADRTNLHAAIVTRICRRSYDIAPMFLFDKPKSGTGATLLVNLVAVLTTGRKSERVTYCNGEMLEFEKRVAATCRAASGVVLLDNLSGVMSSAMLAELLTADDSLHRSGPGNQPQHDLQPPQLRHRRYGQQRHHDGGAGEPDAAGATQRRRGAP